MGTRLPWLLLAPHPSQLWLPFLFKVPVQMGWMAVLAVRGSRTLPTPHGRTCCCC